MKIRIGTRGSALALAQANDIAARLATAGHETEIVVISTEGDRVTDRSFIEVGAFGVFVREIESALLSREVEAPAAVGFRECLRRAVACDDHPADLVDDLVGKLGSSHGGLLPGGGSSDPGLGGAALDCGLLHNHFKETL